MLVSRTAVLMSTSLWFLLGVSWTSGYLLYLESEWPAYLFVLSNGSQVLSNYILLPAYFALEQINWQRERRARQRDLIP